VGQQLIWNSKNSTFKMSNGFDITTVALMFAVTTFIIGILLGVIVKVVFKLALAVLALVVLLVVTGYLTFALSVPSATTIYSVYDQAAPLANQAEGLARLLPISSATFLIGAAIGLWKG
jgi:hypothetical protein